MVLSVHVLHGKAVTLLIGGRQELIIYLFTIFLQLPKNNNSHYNEDKNLHFCFEEDTILVHS